MHRSTRPCSADRAREYDVRRFTIHHLSGVVAAIAGALLLPAPSLAVQSREPVPSASPWQQLEPLSKITISLDFRNAGIAGILAVLSKASGFAIVADPKLTAQLTVQTPHAVPLDDAFDLVNAALRMKGYELARHGSFLIAQPLGGATDESSSETPSTQSPDSTIDRPVHVYRVRYADASNLANAINQAFGGGRQPLSPAQQFGFIRSGRPELVAAAYSGYVDADSPLGVKAVSDDYSNSVIVQAQEAQQTQIASVIEQVDHLGAQPTQPVTVPLSYASAADLRPTIQTVLSSLVPLGRSAQTGGSVTSPSSSSTANGTVTADTRTNSLIVTTTAVNMDEVTQVIAQLDKPTTYESTTFVYVMKNARADVVANLLNESFGNRTTGGAVGGSLTNPTFTSSNIGTATTSGTPGGAAGTGTGTAGGTRVGGGANNGGNFTVTTSNGSQNQVGDSTGLDENGHVVNIRNLTGQVLLVPNIDTNSIIVVCPPEYKTTVTNILDQMDEIPAQVMIQTLVVEASLTKADSLGVEYNFTLKNPLGNGSFTGSQNYGTVSTPTTVSPQNSALGLPAGGQFTLSAGQYSATLSAIEQNSAFNVLSTPRIFTTNNATAQINVSQSIPYLTNSTVDTETGAETNTFNFLDVGIVLTVTPRITSNGYVTMDVTQTANTLVSFTTDDEPITNERETQTTVSVMDGYTVVLGGLIQNQLSDTVNKVPLLGDIPLIGELFRSTSKQNTKTELLVFLTPHVITNPEQGDEMRVATDKQLDKTAQSMLPAVSDPSSPTTK